MATQLIDVIDGIPVASRRRAPSPLKTLTGDQVFFRRVWEYTLVNGVLVYGCAEEGCDFTAAHYQGVTGHLRAVHPHAVKVSHDVMDMPLREVIALASHAKPDPSNAPTWKARAMKAEKELAAIRNALRTAL